MNTKGGKTKPAGTNGQIQYNNNGVFGGVTLPISFKDAENANTIKVNVTNQTLTAAQIAGGSASIDTGANEPFFSWSYYASTYPVYLDALGALQGYPTGVGSPLVLSVSSIGHAAFFILGAGAVEGDIISIFSWAIV